MSTKELIQNINKLSYQERLYVIEKAIKSLNVSVENQMEKAADLLLEDYKHDKNLTCFTSIDFVNFYE
jgi:hypothetical protein